MSDKLNMKKQAGPPTSDFKINVSAAEKPKMLFETQRSWQKAKNECISLIALINELCYEWADLVDITDSWVKPKTMKWHDYHMALYAAYEAFFTCASQGHTVMKVLQSGTLSRFHGGEPRYNFTMMNTTASYSDTFKLHEYNGLGWVEQGDADYQYPVNMPTRMM